MLNELSVILGRKSKKNTHLLQRPFGYVLFWIIPLSFFYLIKVCLLSSFTYRVCKIVARFGSHFGCCATSWRYTCMFKNENKFKKKLLMQTMLQVWRTEGLNDLQIEWGKRLVIEILWIFKTKQKRLSSKYVKIPLQETMCVQSIAWQ